MIKRELLFKQRNITKLMLALMQLQAMDLPEPQRAALYGPITDLHRVLQMTIIFDSAKEVNRQNHSQGKGARVIMINERATQFWAVPFDQVLKILPHLEAKGVETLTIVQQLVEQTKETVVGMLLPDTKVKFLYFPEDEGMRGLTYSYAK